MSAVQLTDHEVAVLIDALNNARNLAEPGLTPNVNSALDKITGLVSPETRGLIVATNRFAPFSDRELVVIHVNCDAEVDTWVTDRDQAICRELADEADSEIGSRPDLVAERDEDD